MVDCRAALMVVVADAEPAVAHLRLQFDPVARLGVSAHVAVLFAFIPVSEIGVNVLARLPDLFRTAPPFHTELPRQDSTFGRASSCVHAHVHDTRRRPTISRSALAASCSDAGVDRVRDRVEPANARECAAIYPLRDLFASIMQVRWRSPAANRKPRISAFPEFAGLPL
jgi:hypothetical protein